MPKKIKSKTYENLGLVVNETDVANNGYADSRIFYGYEWVNKLIFKIKATQGYSIFIQKYTPDGIYDGLNTVGTGFGQTYSSYAGYSAGETTGACIIGYGFRVRIQNKSGADAGDFECYLEVKA